MVLIQTHNGKIHADETIAVALLSTYYSKQLPEEISRGAVIPSLNYIWNEQTGHRFGKSVAKLFMAVNGLPAENYLNLENECKDSRLLKLNLYPISFRNTDNDLWQKYSIKKLTGLESKEAYRIWCFLNRFPAIAKEVKKYSPKVIIGVGVGYIEDFYSCFAGPREAEYINVGQVQSESNKGSATRTYYWSIINDGQTLLAVIPFFSSPNGLNSDELLNKMGDEICKMQKHLAVKIT